MATTNTLATIVRDFKDYKHKLCYESIFDDSVLYAKERLFHRLATVVEQTCHATAERDAILADSKLSAQDYADLHGLESDYWGDQLLHLVDRAARLQEKQRFDRLVFSTCLGGTLALAFMLTLLMQ